jgi:hypothetical protein
MPSRIEDYALIGDCNLTRHRGGPAENRRQH